MPNELTPRLTAEFVGTFFLLLAAIWLLPALWTHTNNTDGVSVILDGLLA